MEYLFLTNHLSQVVGSEGQYTCTFFTFILCCINSTFIFECFDVPVKLKCRFFLWPCRIVFYQQRPQKYNAKSTLVILIWFYMLDILRPTIYKDFNRFPSSSRHYTHNLSINFNTHDRIYYISFLKQQYNTRREVTVR